MTNRTVVWVTEPSRDGANAQAMTLAQALDIQIVMADQASMNAPATIDADDVLWPTDHMGLRDTLLELEPDVVVFHTLNRLARQTLPQILPYAAVAVRLGVNVRSALLAGKYEAVPQYLECVTLADRVISSGTHTSQTLRALGVDDRAVVEIPSAIDTRAVREPPDRAHQAIGTIGRIDRTKNQWLTVETAAAIRRLEADRQPDVLLAGEARGALLGVIRASIDHYGLGDAVKHMGYVPDPVENYYPRLGVHLHPSWTENCPLTVLEAAVAGVPTIAADMTWARDFPGVVTAPLDDPMAWADAALKLLRDDEHRRAAVAAQQQHLERFSLERVVPQYRELFDAIAAGPGRAKIPAGVVA